MPDNEPVVETQEGVSQGTSEEPVDFTQEQIDAATAILGKRPELLSKYITEMPEDAFGKLPGVEPRISRLVDVKSKKLSEEAVKKQREWEQSQARETARKQQERAWAQQIVSQVEAMPPQQRQATLQQPQNWERYKEAMDIIATRQSIPGMFTPEEAAKHVYKGLLGHLNETTPGPSYEEAQTVEELVDMATGAGAEKIRKQLKEEMDKELDARITELRNQLHISADQPERGTGQGARGKASFTGAQIRAMSLKEYKARESEIEEAIREGRYKE